jgi:hypothetical protein
MRDARDPRHSRSVEDYGPSAESQAVAQGAPGKSTRTELLPEHQPQAGEEARSQARGAASDGERAGEWAANESLMMAMGLGIDGGASGPVGVNPSANKGQQYAGRGSVTLSAPPSNPTAAKAARIQHTMTSGDDWQPSVIATLEQAEPAERIAIERLLPMPALIEKLSAWEATRLGTLGPVPDGQELLNRKRVAYFKQVLDDYPPSYAQVFLLYALQAACLDEASEIVAELANARRLSKLRALPAVAQRLTSLGVDLSVFQEPSEPWARVLRGAGRSLSRFAKDDRPGKYGSQKAELPTEYAEALSEVEVADAIEMLSPGNVAMGGFDEVTFGLPHGVVDLGRSTVGGVRDLAHGEYEQAGEQLAGAGVIVLTHLGIKAWNVVRGGTKAGPTATPTPKQPKAPAPDQAPGLRGSEGPGQFTLANFEGPITAEEAKLGAIFCLNAEAQAALGRILSRIGRGGLEKVATLVNANSRVALFVAEHGEAGLYALLEADGEMSAARAKLAAGGHTTQSPLALPAAAEAPGVDPAAKNSESQAAREPARPRGAGVPAKPRIADSNHFGCGSFGTERTGSNSDRLQRRSSPRRARGRRRHGRPATEVSRRGAPR